MTLQQQSKEKVAVFVSPNFPGHVNPLLSLARLFRKNDYQVHFFCGGNFREKIQSAGAEFHCDGPSFNDGDMIAASMQVAAKKFGVEVSPKTGGFVEMIIPAGVGFMETDGFVDRVKALKPTVIVSDMGGVWGTWTAKILKVPSITSFSGAFMDAEEQFGYAREIELTKKIEAWLKTTHNVSVDAVTSIVDPGNFLISWGFPELQPSFRPERSKIHWFGAAHPKDILCLVAEAAKKDQAAGDGSSIVNWIEAEKAKGKTVVYCSMGTMAPVHLKTTTAFFPKVIEAFGNSEKYSCILSIGRDQKPEDLDPPVPDNFVALPFVNQNLVLSKVDAFITHGGNNSVNESFFMGCPMLCIPCFGDQFQNGAMIEQTNCGAQIESPIAPKFLENFDHVTPSLLVEKLDGIMGSAANRDKVKASCASMQKHIRSLHEYYHDGAAFADIEAYIAEQQ